MPKQKITKEMVVEAAFELARKGGMEQVIVKNIAERLNCSVQPIYSYCKNMEELRRDVIARAISFVKGYTAGRTDSSDPFHSTGQAYLRLAKEEPEIFKLFILHQRGGISSLEDLYRIETDPQIFRYIMEETGLDAAQAKQLHLNMLIYMIGIGTIFSVTTPGIPADEIFARLEYAYRAFLNQALVSQKGVEKF